MRVFITSTPEELAPHQAAAMDVAAELGHEVVLRNPALGRGLEPVEACARQVAYVDVLLALVGHRRGAVPSPEDGGDGRHPWAWWETRAAFGHGKPVLALITDEDTRPVPREDDPRANAVVRDFRGELARLAVPFDADDTDGFRVLVRQLLETGRTPSTDLADVALRRWPPPPLPERPYPVLLPYNHPELLAGRERELAELRQLLAQSVPIVGLHAPSGTGKSSFLYGGLAATLRAEGRPLAFDRHPCEGGLASRLLGDLVEGDSEVADDDPHTFVDRLRAVRRQADVPAVLVLDQFEDLFRDPESRARAVVGTLLAASAQRLPGLAEAPCRWILAYRQEFHGEVYQWLADVLGDARDLGWEIAASLPHDLSGSDRFHAWSLSPLGTPAPGTEDRAGEAARVFQAVIEKPLALTSENGESLYPWRFAKDDAARLARAFGEARVARPTAPLTPELQVVLAHLLERFGRPADGKTVDVEVGDATGELIDSALEEHLRRSLDVAFPAGRKATIGRTRALLALRELADVHGRRDEGSGGARLRRDGRPVEALARALGEDGRDVLEKLATPQTRLVLLERHGEEQVYVLSHDRMAEVIVRLVDDGGTYAGLGVDAELLGLRRFVALHRELFTSGEVEQATEVPKDRFSGIERHTDALLWDDEGRRWWTACGERRRRDRRRKRIRRGTAAAAVALLTVVVWIWASRFFERQALLEQIVSGEPEAAFAALAVLTAEAEVDAEQFLAQVRQREMPFDVLERGLGGVDENRRGEALLRVAELLVPLQQAEAPEDPVWIASMVWALDFFARPDPALREQAVALRGEILGPLRWGRPPPVLSDLDGPEWANVPAGTFLMGSGPGEGRDEEDKMDERPKHPVSLSAFRLMVHEVTNAEFGRLFPAWDEREEELPAASMTWHEAYTYAAWLGGRLPTEAEWEYAARAGCRYAYCKRDGSEATLDDVAWWVGNSTDPETGEPSAKRVRQREPNPWGLYDVYGNVWEWNANWYYLYPEEHENDPVGTRADSDAYRTSRGGSAWNPAEWVASSGRGVTSRGRSPRFGLRVALPGDVRF